MNAARAWRKIDVVQERAKAERDIRLAEARARAEDRAAVARNDDYRMHVKRLANGHLVNCACPRCDRNPYTCPAPACARVLKGPVAYATHLRWHKRLANRAPVLAPDAAGFLKAVVGPKASAYDLSALTRFAQLLADAARSKTPAVRRRAYRHAIAEYEAAPQAVALVGARVPGAAAALAYKLALQADVTPNAAIGALVLYGLERLADDLRRARRAPNPHVPGFTADAAQTQTNALFPSADESENI